MLKEYQIIKQIGQGASGQVYVVHKNEQSDNKNEKINQSNSELFAMKTISTKKLHLDIQTELLPSLKHPNVISTKEVIQGQGGVTFIMDYASNGDLHAYTQENYFQHNKLIDSKTLVKWLVQLCLGLHYLHDHLRIIHRDIKMKNILVMKNGLLKLADFGISRKLEKGEEFAQTSLGTPECLSPQMYNLSKYDHKTDVWGLGCIMFELCTGTKPFYSNTMNEMFKNIMEKQYGPEDLPHSYPLWLRQIIIEMLDKQFSKRPTMQSLLEKSEIRQAFQEIKLAYPNEYSNMIYPALSIRTTKHHQKDEKMLQIFTLKTTKNENDKNPKFGSCRTINTKNSEGRLEMFPAKKVQKQKFLDRSLKAIIIKSQKKIE